MTTIDRIIYSAPFLSKIKFSPQRRRGRREDHFLFVPVQPEQTKSFQPLAGHVLAEGLGFMENRYLSILHKTILLRDLCVSAVNLIFKEANDNPNVE